MTDSSLITLRKRKWTRDKNLAVFFAFSVLGCLAGGTSARADITNSAVVQVAIRDYGIGIDPSEHQKIFRRFYQVDGGTARRYPGTGLGLAIAKSVVEGHGGRIGVKSNLNEGATFVFTIPKNGI